MLSASEFTVGTLADAKPLSLMLPRSKYEVPCLVGHVDNIPTGVFLSSQFRFHAVEAKDGARWSGLIVPNVRVLIDETSLFDPGQTQTLGAIVRTETSLSILAQKENRFGRTSPVTLEANLPSTNDMSAGFLRWQVVIGDGTGTRVLHEVDLRQV